MADLSRVESIQYPAAHYGHLTENQQQQLDAFKLLCQEQGYYTPADLAKDIEASHDDETMLRFLRARRFVPQDAFKQFKDTEDWRKEHDLGNLYKTIDIEEYEQTRRLYPQWLGRRDKRGIPVYVFEVAPLNSKNIAGYEKQLANSTSTSTKVATKHLRLFALYESLIGFVQPLCSAVARRHPETPISQSNNIVDISGVGLKQFWNLKGHMQDASQLATAHYPETLDRIFIIGAPAFFPTVWGWIKRWFDPITVSKIFILSSADVFPTLSQYIDPENIPKKYGGQLDFKWGDLPHLEPAIESSIEWINPNIQEGRKTFPIGPITWEKHADGSLTAIAIGTEKGQPRHRPIFRIPHPVNANIRAGQPIENTPVDEAELRLTTVGTATQPPDTDIDAASLEPPPSDTDTPESNSIPAPSTTDSRSLPVREGTSETRYAQQDRTHAAGQLADGTPDAAVKDHGHGDKTVTMEPSTVGQAPKDVSIKTEGSPAPGIIDQAKQVAAQASAAVASAASTVAGGVSGSAAQEKVVEKSAEEKNLEAEVDAKADPVIEEYLREKTKVDA
ncbi:CRAL/TRIO domain-containing protein [Westerdykella ornata]|uniref:CRAL/TRIO domain-containing protein n=1 Tax=Westerdykella ornata TaxID=318751 RepID=A0A6A6JPM6_WESOR|nr:CRAL/TRIO domain-containing protein [Westerdykella ornata]KAF2278337.1 CRAL/TRIO domain-containing protein [Westerdykella ornata]